MEKQTGYFFKELEFSKLIKIEELRPKGEYQYIKEGWWYIRIL